MKTTWHEEPEKRPSFADIVQFLHGQNIEDTPINETDSAISDSENDSSYLDILQT